MGPPPCLAVLGRFRELQRGKASRADTDLEGAAAAKGLSGEGTVRALALATASLSGLCAGFWAKLGGFKFHLNCLTPPPKCCQAFCLPAAQTLLGGG